MGLVRTLKHKLRSIERSTYLSFPASILIIVSVLALGVDTKTFTYNVCCAIDGNFRRKNIRYFARLGRCALKPCKIT